MPGWSTAFGRTAGNDRGPDFGSGLYHFSMTSADFWIPTREDMEFMSPEELHEVTEILYRLKQDEDEEWLPQPKQALATSLATRAVETLYGGAAGGGKSEWLLHYLLTQMLQHPFNRGVVFRRFFPNLERTLIDRSKQIYPKHGGRYNEVKHTWRFPNGSVLEMGSLPTYNDVTNFQGAEYGVIAFEEITEFEERMVDALIVRLRPPGPGIRSHLIATCNPGGRGHRWVKRRWVKPKPDDYVGSQAPLPYEVWTPVSKPENPEPNSRVFVPATLEDNPILEQRDPTYRNKIRAMANSDKALALAMEHGDWDAIDAVEGALWKQSDLDGGRVSEQWFRLNVIPQIRVLAVDPSDGNEDGKGDEYGVCVFTLGMDGIGYVQYTAGWRASPDMMAKKTVQLAAEMGCDYIVVEKNHGGKWVKTTIQSKDRYAVIRTVWASEGKVTRARPVAGLFAYDEDLVDLGLEYRIKMVGTAHEKFEEQATTYTGAPGEVSPNEMDAVVWAATELLLQPQVSRDGDQYDDERLSGRR
jgi:hypothetical protein